MKALHMVSWILLIVGGLNWLCMGLFAWDIGMLFGEAGNTVSRIIYILVGLAAIVELVFHKRCCNWCLSSKDTPAQTM